MKVTISIPEKLFTEGERLARRLRIPRSKLYRRALSQYIASRSPDFVTESMNRVCDQVGTTIDPFVTEAGRRVLKQTEW